jgi:hypothetical protein
MQEVKGTLRSGTSYQGSLISTEEETKFTREAPDQCLLNLEGPGIEEIPYEKEPECAKLTSSILLAPVPEPVRKSINTEETKSSHNSCTAHVTHMH